MRLRMRHFFCWVLFLLFKFIFSLRYKVTVKGLDKINSQNLTKKGGILFLPNHPTIVVDPTLVGINLVNKFHIRPVIVEYMYYTPGIRQLMDLMNALPVPKFSATSNSIKKQRTENVLEKIIEGVEQGENFLIYPAGRLRKTAYEVVGGASGVHSILKEAPETNVVLVRTKGLWGSMFSNALGPTPVMSSGIIQGIKIALKNAIFFIPRRRVTIELEPAPADFPYQGTRTELNSYLEKWYNRPDGLSPQEGAYPGDSLVLVPYTFWSKKVPVIDTLPVLKEETLTNQDIPLDIRQKVIAKVAEIAEIDPRTVKPELRLSEDLGMDSLDSAELVLFLQDQFDIEGVPVGELQTVGKLMNIAARQVEVKEEQEETVEVSKDWLSTGPLQPAKVFPGETLPEMFLNAANEMKNAPAFADNRSGVISYSKLKLRSLVLSQYLKKLPEKYIGVLLPASVGASACILAIQMAGKVPVLINWTVGARHLETVADLTKVKTILTAWAFIDKLENVDLTPIQNQLLMLEDLRRDLSIQDKLKAWLLSHRSPAKILSSLSKTPPTGNSEAVILFTSGTESMPKGVPLTHINIISTLKNSLSCVNLNTHDSLLGILPPFHSFGFLVSVYLCLLAGIKTFLFPNPTEGKKIADIIEKWKITLLVGAPTFLKGIIKAAQPGQLNSILLVVSGAEKAPPELLHMLEDIQKEDTLLEGYGITECSPVLTLTRPNQPLVGVGKPIPEVEILIADPETYQPLGLNTRGMILARGPNIFGGYLNPGLDPPFVEVKGKKWYRTGDLGFLDEEGRLTISGRLKRFIKVGPEMISLPAIEDALLQIGIKKQWWEHQEGPPLAVIGREQMGERPKIKIVSKFPLELDKVNLALREAGFSNLVRISDVHVVEEIPLMGTGKINYRALEGLYF